MYILRDDFGWKVRGALDFDEHSISAKINEHIISS